LELETIILLDDSDPVSGPVIVIFYFFRILKFLVCPVFFEIMKISLSCARYSYEESRH